MADNPEMSQVKLVVSDMDGTLLNSKGELNDRFFNVFKQLQSKNILFIAASGRQYYSIIKRLDPIKDHIIVIAENGSYVRHRDEELLIQGMDMDIVKELIVKLRTIHGVYPILCGRKTAYIESSEDEFIENSIEYFERIELVDDLLAVCDDDFLKIAVCDLNGSAQNSYPQFQTYIGKLQVKVSGKIWLDISHPLATKGHALAMIQEKYGISPLQTIVFGDYFNDIEMLQQAYFSYAMTNAQPEVKNAARFIAKSNDEDGVIEVLNQLIGE